MSKRKTRNQEHEAQFPFRLIQFWLEPIQDGQELRQCQCRKRTATYANTHYMDMFRQARLVAEGRTEREATDLVWNQARDEQMKKHYTKYAGTFHCTECVKLMIRASNGDQVTALAFLPSQILGMPQCFIMGCMLASMNDDGHPFLIPVRRGTSFEDAIKLMQSGENFDIHLNG
jgi:hypothetical protein